MGQLRSREAGSALETGPVIILFKISRLCAP